MGAERVVLIVDDDHAVLETMQMLLEGKGGFRVHCTVGSRGATRCLTAHARVDLVIADVILAGEISGIDICRMARRLHPQVGLLVISADPQVDLETLPAQSVYLRKPFGGDGLTLAIEQALVLAAVAPSSVSPSGEHHDGGGTHRRGGQPAEDLE